MWHTITKQTGDPKSGSVSFCYGIRFPGGATPTAGSGDEEANPVEPGVLCTENRGSLRLLGFHRSLYSVYFSGEAAGAVLAQASGEESVLEGVSLSTSYNEGNMAYVCCSACFFFVIVSISRCRYTCSSYTCLYCCGLGR